MKLTCFKKISILLAVITVLFVPVSLSAADFGLVLNLHSGYSDTGSEDNTLDFKADIWPRYSLLIGDDGEFLVTAGVTLGIDDGFYFLPELLQTELTMRFGSSQIRAGRINYSDPLSFILEGLFDGVTYNYRSAAGNFSVGAFYSGFLYKRNIYITMTEKEKEDYAQPVDYGDFFGTYFAPGRAFLTLGYEHPSLGEFISFNAALIGQFDLSNSPDKYHNQYLILKAGIPFSSFLLELGGSIEVSQSNSVGIAFAGEASFHWLFASEFNSRLSFNARIASGKTEDFCEAFIPITTKYYGFIYKHKMSALSVFSVNYTSRLTQSLGASVTGSYFVRNDLGTVLGYPTETGNNGFFLGPEFSANVIWSPASDLQLNLGAGIFIPALGDAGPNERINWRCELTVTMGIF